MKWPFQATGYGGQSSIQVIGSQPSLTVRRGTRLVVDWSCVPSQPSLTVIRGTPSTLGRQTRQNKKFINGLVRQLATADSHKSNKLVIMYSDK